MKVMSSRVQETRQMVPITNCYARFNRRARMREKGFIWIRSMPMAQSLPIFAITFTFSLFFTMSASLNAPTVHAENQSAPLVLLVTLDTLRSDTPGFGGNPRSISPWLDRLAKQAVQFSDVTTPSPYTHPSLASLLTGMLPVHHGSVFDNRVLDRQNVTLSEVFQRHGMRTEAIVCNVWLSQEFGFDQGFSAYHYSERDLIEPELHDRILSAIERIREAPEFLWLHYLAPHAPYEPFEPYLAQYEQDYSERTMSFSIEDVQRHKSPDARLTPVELHHLKLLYESQLRLLDRLLGDLFLHLRKTGSPVQLVVTADHGEEFKEHGGMGHDHTLYQELLSVPLIIQGLPGIRERQLITTPVQIVDIMPTLLEAAGIQTGHALDGSSLLPVLQGHPDAPGRPFFSMRYFIDPRNHLFAVRIGEYKAIVLCPYLENNPGTMNAGTLLHYPPTAVSLSSGHIEDHDTTDMVRMQLQSSGDCPIQVAGTRISFSAQRMRTEIAGQLLDNCPTGVPKVHLLIGTRNGVVALDNPLPWSGHDLELASYVFESPQGNLMGIRSVDVEFLHPRTRDCIPLGGPKGSIYNRLNLFRNPSVIPDQIRIWSVPDDPAAIMLFNLTDHPGEQRVGFITSGEIRDRLLSALREFNDSDSFTLSNFRNQDMATDLESKLRQLGYLE